MSDLPEEDDNATSRQAQPTDDARDVRDVTELAMSCARAPQPGDKRKFRAAYAAIWKDSGRQKRCAMLMRPRAPATSRH